MRKYLLAEITKTLEDTSKSFELYSNWELMNSFAKFRNEGVSWSSAIVVSGNRIMPILP